MGIGSPWPGSSHSARSSDVPYKGCGLRSSAPVQCYFRGKRGGEVMRGRLCSKGLRRPAVALGTISSESER